MRRTKEDAEATRKAILKAALEIFSQKGYHPTTLEDVALAAKMTRGAVYWHFKNKEDLLNNLLDDYEVALSERAITFAADKRYEKCNLSERGLAWITIWAETLAGEVNMFKTRFMHSIQNPGQGSELRKEAHAALGNAISGFFMPVLAEIQNPQKEKAFAFIIRTIDTSMVYRIVLENKAENLQAGSELKKMIEEYHNMFVSYLGLKK